MSKISYTDSGFGPVIVFVHGFCETKEVWSAFINSLHSNFRVICVDLPGYGDSPLHAPLSMESMADSIFDLLQLLGIQKVIIIGHSMGGYVSLAFADRHSAMVAGLGLFHSTTYADSDEKKLQRNKTIKYLEEHGVEAFIKPFVPPLFAAPNRKRCEKAINFLIEIGLKTPEATIIACAEAMRDRPDRSHVLANSMFPVLFIIGKNDHTTKAEDAFIQAQLPYQCYMQMLGDTAHQGMFEREEETLKMIHAFVGLVYF
jgi:pimeloyl-ACP methyl ester carboxylesterase